MHEIKAREALGLYLSDPRSGRKRDVKAARKQVAAGLPVSHDAKSQAGRPSVRQKLGPQSSAISDRASQLSSMSKASRFSCKSTLSMRQQLASLSAAGQKLLSKVNHRKKSAF